MKNTQAHQKLGGWLKTKRLAAGLSQTQLAKQIGRHKTFVSKYEAGRRLDIGNFLEVCRAVKADPHEGVELMTDD